MNTIPSSLESVVDSSPRPLRTTEGRRGVTINARVIGQEELSFSYVLDGTLSPGSPLPAEQPPLAITVPMPPEVYWAGRACAEITDEGKIPGG